MSPNQVAKTDFRTLTRVTLNSLHVMNVLIDSGADESLMDWGLAKKLQIESKPLARPIQACSLNGKEIFSITHVTRPVKMSVGEHHEMIQFHLFTSLSHSLILGQPWLYEHNPYINWKNGQIRGWGEKCMKRCHLERVADFNLFSANPVADPDYPDLTTVPPYYHPLKEVFNKSKALSLSPHRPYDCAIDLIPGSTIPKGRLYSISGPERKAMNDYISASLKAGLIRPSSSPAGASFFFVGKKDGSLRPCIDYSPLNDITIKNRYPLPLMTSVFDQLQQAKIFTKLDLRNAYHLVCIREGDEWKTGFNTPSGHYEYCVMPFG